MSLKRLLLLLFLLCSSLHAVEEEEEVPWYAGNIISNYGMNIVPGVMYLEAYFYANRIRGIYNTDGDVVLPRNVHQYFWEIEWAMGWSERVDFTVDLSAYYIDNDGHQTAQWGDTEVYLGFQLLKGEKKNHIPYIRLLVGEIFPTGKYDGLNPQFSGGDGVGFGAFNTFFSLIVQQFYYGKHPFNWTLNLYYYLPSQVQVNGSNMYIHDLPIKGKILPGNQFAVDFALEYKFNQPWGCGLDVYYQQQNSSYFHNQGGEVPSTTIPAMQSLSLAPSIEYNFSASFGMLAGAWFTVLGQNTAAFASFAYAFYYQF